MNSIFRTINSFLPIAVAIAVAGCSKDSLGTADNASKVAPEYFLATLEQDPETKVVLNTTNFTQTWEDGDKIVVNGATYKRQDNTEKFYYYSGGFTYNPGGQMVAVYPSGIYSGGTATGSNKYSLPYTYIWNTKSKKVDYIPLAGIADADNTVAFKNLTSLFKITVTNAAPDTTVYLKSVTVSSDLSMSGDFTLSFSSGVPSISFVSSGTTYPSIEMQMDSVVALAPNASYTVYLPVPAQEYNSFNVKAMVYLDEAETYGSIRFYNSSASRGGSGSEYASSLTCARGKVYSMTVNAKNYASGILGDGSSLNPYLIGSITDLAYIQRIVSSASDAAKKHFVSSYYKLTNDINLTSGWNKSLSLGNESYAFSGVFDGDGHTIYAEADTNRASIFWNMKHAVIKNVKLKGDFAYDMTVSGDFGTWSPFCMEGWNTCLMLAVIFDGSVTASNNTTANGTSFSVLGSYCGRGLDPHNFEMSKIVGCYAKAKIEDKNTTDSAIGHQIYGRIRSSWTMKANGATPYGVVGDLTFVSGKDDEHYHTENNSLVVSTLDNSQKADEMSAAITEWNAGILQKKKDGSITEEEYNRQKSNWNIKYENSSSTFIFTDGTL